MNVFMVDEIESGGDADANETADRDNDEGYREPVFY